MESDVALREASDDDAAALAQLLQRTRSRALPDCEVWVAETPERIVGFIAYTSSTIEHLYVEEGERGAGIGSTLLAWALRDGAARELWASARNARAIAFYEARGFAIVERTDGSDVRMRREAGPLEPFSLN